MFCKWCGMESAAADLCSWCHRPLSATATAAPHADVKAPPAADPAAGTLAEEPGEDESAPATGLAAGRSVRRPAPAHRPAWAPVPRAGAPAPPRAPGPAAPPPQVKTAAPAAARTPAPFAPAPFAPAPAAAPRVPAPAAPTQMPPPAAVRPTEPERPVIGVRRPGGAAPPMRQGAPIGVRRTGVAAPSPAPPPRSVPPVPSAPAPRAPAPPALAPRPPMPAAPRPPIPNAPLNRTATTSAPAPSAVRPAAPGAAVASHDPFARSGMPAGSHNAGAQTAAPPAARPEAPRTRPLALPQDEEEETGGLAEGIAAGRKPITRTTGVPALGTFTPANSKYYSGQVVDPMSGNHYDSATGRATSVAAQTKTDDIVLHWDDPVSTPLHISRFSAAFAGIMVVMALLVRLLPDYSALPLVAALFAAGGLLAAMRAVPFQSDDSDDVVWFLLLTLLFGPAIGLLIYSVKAFLLRDMNIAVLGLLVVSFVTYLVFQIAAPIVPTTPDAAEGFFSLMKLAPPWTQVNRYGYAAMLINWAGIFALIGWIGANVFHKLDE